MSDIKFLPQYKHRMIRYNFNNYVQEQDCVMNINRAYEKGRADAFKEFADSYRKFQITSPNETCLKADDECDGTCIDCFEKWVTNKKEHK